MIGHRTTSVALDSQIVNDRHTDGEWPILARLLPYAIGPTRPCSRTLEKRASNAAIQIPFKEDTAEHATISKWAG